MKSLIRTYIGIGSNLSYPLIQVKTALNELALLPYTKFYAASRLYRSKPMGPYQDQPDFINAVAVLDTTLSAEQLLMKLQHLEKLHGRPAKRIAWGPRTLDLDLLLYGNETITTPILTVPHPGIELRSWVLYPLADIDPELKFPNGNLLADLLIKYSDNSLEIISS